MFAARAFAALLPLLGCTQALAADPTPATPVEAPAPAALEKVSDFTLRGLDGQSHSLSPLLGKKVVVVSFWATWCTPCMKEMPHLDKLQKKLADKGLQVISISVDAAKDEAKVKSVVRGMNYGPLVLLDQEARVVNLFNPRKDMPWTMIVGKDGLIHHKKKGFTEGDEVELERLVGELIAK